MSRQLINRSPDLTRLRDEGYEIEIRSNHLLVKNVPYLNANKEVKFGTLVSDLTLAGDVTTRPGNHVAYFIGDHPCNQDGSQMVKIKHKSKPKNLGEDLEIQHSFSSKPKKGYTDYYQKLHTYFTIISGPAYAVDPKLERPTPLVIQLNEDESVFHYAETASSRLGINLVTKKLEIGPVAIVGLGGTGSYIFDLVAKTPVSEIHLFDGDEYLQHNAFRSPGAPSVNELRTKPKKVEYFKSIYSKMHRYIYAHPEDIHAANVDKLSGMSFVFICLDKGEPRRLIVDKLEEAEVPFIDVGMGVELVDNSLHGILRATASSVEKREHVANKVPFSDGGGNNDYSTNIQIADLNALNAALAVIKWKKMYNFYTDLGREFSITYTIDGNVMLNEDKDEAVQ